MIIQLFFLTAGIHLLSSPSTPKDQTKTDVEEHHLAYTIVSRRSWKCISKHTFWLPENQDRRSFTTLSAKQKRLLMMLSILWFIRASGPCRHATTRTTTTTDTIRQVCSGYPSILVSDTCVGSIFTRTALLYEEWMRLPRRFIFKTSSRSTWLSLDRSCVGQKCLLTLILQICQMCLRAY